MAGRNWTISACILARNMASLIPACVNSLSWVDGIYLYDDGSTDGTIERARGAAKVPIHIERSRELKPAFERGEMQVRNKIIDCAFRLFSTDLVIVLDADELLSVELAEHIEDKFDFAKYDSIAFSTYHLRNDSTYLHFWATSINGENLVDPHTRVITHVRRFQKLCGDGSHPIIEATSRTLAVEGAFHFHLKYHEKSKLPNYSLNFLPEIISDEVTAPYCRILPRELPKDISDSIELINWDTMSEWTSTPHYEVERMSLSSEEALIHPKDISNE